MRKKDILFHFLKYSTLLWIIINVLFSFFLSFFGHMVQHVEILVPPPGVEPTSPAAEAKSLSHWAARKVLIINV